MDGRPGTKGQEQVGEGGKVPSPSSHVLSPPLAILEPCKSLPGCRRPWCKSMPGCTGGRAGGWRGRNWDELTGDGFQKYILPPGSLGMIITCSSQRGEGCSWDGASPLLLFLSS